MLGRRLYRYALALAFLCQGCSSSSERLCEKDTFFCDENWEHSLPELSTWRVYELNHVFASANRYEDAVLGEEFMRRGPKTLDVILDSKKNLSYFDYGVF